MSTKTNAAGLIVSGEKIRTGRAGKSKRFAPYVASNTRLSGSTRHRVFARFSALVSPREERLLTENQSVKRKHVAFAELRSLFSEATRNA